MSDSGQVQIAVWNNVTSTWGDWVSEESAYVSTSAGWSQRIVDLSHYAGETIQIGFHHNAYRACCGTNESSGWYVDEVGLYTLTPTLTTDLESGWCGVSGVLRHERELRLVHRRPRVRRILMTGSTA